MNFDTNNSIGALGSKTTRGKVSAPTTEGKSTTPEKAAARTDIGDQVVLSQEAQSAGRLQAKINSLPDANLERVAEIRRAIAEGRFEINPERIAENMLNQEDLLN
ncbi:flagellar biosynthesis anti-sigma factor FlgM [Cellvibrio japonicus]|uniref:Negative regulator of flagellin synthesis n=1 Tax=Cellvibrio japonicus (strain Ueda107) TaxID=498211 RepID=B3PGT3_CELJU|nr:flagellar biosynthesis anti-sigma factor FlgM [Cellvibrio japonicus]ACE83541.1 putative negative regulator of flagellin synthesis FlgM [Cellvibrio japonicus Ueda107]QEI12427.1 flagellar biosynthesis anti-sigma factor FlgM [Cellvibrio japonicus]QEI16000.1 flagellar biosynthesis anti-sigma factor FlgM [Cellvibrio japonicus]QEI19579.1 flagellar biosynthesis anti-sigma factor FlgM [Cellvibrio japonicus]